MAPQIFRPAWISAIQLHPGNLEGEVNDTVEIKQENGSRSYSIYSEGRAKGLLALTQPDNVVRDSEGTITAKGLLRPSTLLRSARQKVAEDSHFRLEQEIADPSV